MTISIVKDDDFNTVGFQAACDGVTMYSFGITPANSPVYIKSRLATADEVTKVCELMRLHARLSYLKGFAMDWFAVASSNGIEVEDGIKFTERNNAIANCQSRIEHIIDTFK